MFPLLSSKNYSTMVQKGALDGIYGIRSSAVVGPVCVS